MAKSNLSRKVLLSLRYCWYADIRSHSRFTKGDGRHLRANWSSIAASRHALDEKPRESARPPFNRPEGLGGFSQGAPLARYYPQVIYPLEWGEVLMKIGMEEILAAISVPILFAAISSAAASGESAHPDARPAIDQTCEISPGAPGKIVVIGNLVRNTNGPAPGAVLISEKKIEDVGTADDILSSAPNATVIDCGQSYVSPGLVNAHEHPDHSGMRPDPKMTKHVYTHREQWQAWVPDRGKKGADGHYKIDYKKDGRPVRLFWVELRHLLAGTTTMAGNGAVFGLVKNVSSDSEANYVYRADMMTFPYPLASKVFEEISCPFEGLPPDEEKFVPSFSKDFDVDKPYVPHIAEGTDCTAKLEGQFFLDYVSENPGRRYTLIHGLGLNAASIERLAPLDVTLVWSPRSNLALYGETVNIPSVLDTGARVALGTDWSYSGSYNMLETFRCAEAVDNAEWRRLSARDLWRMATEHAAYALGIEALTGKIEPGFAADLVVFRRRTDDPYNDLAGATVSDVMATFVDGTLLSGLGEAFAPSSLPARCRHRIGKHFICAEYDGTRRYGFDHQRLLRENEKAAPLFEPDGQAKCRGYEKVY